MRFDIAAVWSKLGAKSTAARRRLTRLAVTLTGIVALAILGWAGVSFPLLSGGLERLSYDLPFHWRAHISAPELCIIYLDDKSTDTLRQGYVWSRALHARLIRHLTAQGARAIVFDIVFGGPSAEHGADEALAAAIKEHGRVYLGGSLDLSAEAGQYQERITPPYSPLRKAAAGWGLLVFRPVEPDYGVRRIYSGSEQKAAAVWVAAQGLGAPFPDTPEERAKTRYVNYYGPTGYLSYVSYAAALAEDGVPPGFFKDKIVLIGGRASLGPLSLGKDEFATPYTRRGFSAFAPGVEIHATALLNLIRGDWLSRLPVNEELALVVACAVLLGALFSLLRPLLSISVALVAAAGLAWWATHLVWDERLWFNWLIPVAVQIPLGLAWSLCANYFFVTQQRTMLSRAFDHYLSPEMVRRIRDGEAELRPGGQRVVATVMFTDLKNFADLSDRVQDPEKIASILNEYFTHITEFIFATEGTIIKFIGDAVLAVWGTPVPDPQHQAKALQAAYRIGGPRNFTVKHGDEVKGYELVTRVGLHTGSVLAGNLGSVKRFDYTVIGDAVNLAARFESLNKYLGTSVILSEETLSQLPAGANTRLLGQFCVVGKKSAIRLFELLPPDVSADAAWLQTFAHGLAQFVAGDLETASACFAQANKERPDGDGPSEFYIQHILELRESPTPPAMPGCVEMKSK